jgi:uncharacterized membrane protein YdbT with pleckstrin-like domain
VPQFLPSELPVRATTRQHWIVLFRRVHKWTLLLLVVLVLASIVRPYPALGVLVLVVAVIAGWRYLLWRNERIYLTGKRVVRMEGIPALTRHEAWLRVDRISGARFDEEGLARLLGYATIHLEAPGDHPGIKHLIKVSRPSRFYLVMRDTVFGETWSPDPDDGPDERPTDYVTAPLPRLDLDKHGDTGTRRYRRSR